AESASGELERDARAGGGLGEQRADLHALQRLAAGRALCERARLVLRALEQCLDLVAMQSLECDQMSKRAVGATLLDHHSRSTLRANRHCRFIESVLPPAATVAE